MSTTRDTRLAFRSIRRTPGFTAVAVLTLALGIGANTAIFSVVNGVLLKPLPFPEQDRLVGVWHKAPGWGSDRVNQAPALYFTYREENRVFEDVGLWDNLRVSVTERGDPERLAALAVSDGTLPLLRAEAQIGRRFSPEDDRPGSPKTVMLGHGYWQRRFSGDPSAVGQPLKIDGEIHEIIGVLPRNFRFLNFDPPVLIPLQFDRAKAYVGRFSTQCVARLKPGVTLDQANADVSRMIPLATEKFPRGMTLENLRAVGFDANLRPFKQDAIGRVGSTLWILLGTVGLVLLIACANVANLFLVRAEGRQRELAVRMALGADWASVAKRFMTESVLLSALGGMAGLALALGGLRLLLALEPSGLPRLREISIDSSVLLFTLSISLGAGLLFGLFPVAKYARPGLALSLKETGRGGGQGRERQRARNILVVSQIALALVLLVGAGLMIRSFQALLRVEPGFSDPEHLLTFRLSVPRADVEDENAAVRVHRRIAERLQAIPGVASVGLASSVPMDGWRSNNAIEVEGFPPPEGERPPVRRLKWISPNYFETIGNPLLAGRAINWYDIESRADVVMITRNMALRLWDSPAEAVGKRLRLGSEEASWREIIGVVGDVHDDGVDREATTIVYWPMLVADFWGREVFARRTMAYAVRSSRVGNPGFMGEVRDAVWSLNANLPLARVYTQQEWLDHSMSRTSFTLVMLAVAAAVAILLAAVGIYGVVSYAVSQRTREIGVRMALGARRSDVGRLVLRQGLLLAGAGIALGLLGAAALTRLMSSILFGVAPTDPVTYACVSTLLVAIALAASYLPARRASGVHPMEALRWG